MRRILILVTAGWAGLVPVAAAAGPSASAGATPALPAGSLQIAGPVLMVRDLERSIRFYTEGLGMTLSTRLPGNPGPGAVVVGPGGGPSPFVLLRQREREAGSGDPMELGNGLSRIMLSVADIEAVAARLRAAGYAVPPLNGRHIVFVTDPDGYRYELMQTGARH